VCRECTQAGCRGDVKAALARDGHLPQLQWSQLSIEPLRCIRDEADVCARLAFGLHKFGCTGIRLEWPVHQPNSCRGVGDVLATLPCGTELAVEVKFFASGAGKPTKRSFCTLQAARYGLLLACTTYRPVVCATFNNVDGLVYLGAVTPPSSP
jgi:hypothetical protein